MEAKRYLRMGIFGIIIIILAVTAYAIFLNEASRRHIDKMEAAQYTILEAVHADYHKIRTVVKDASIRVEPLWTIDVKAQHDGTLSEIYVDLGEHVEAGKMLASMTDAELGSQLASAEASIDESRATLFNYEQILRRDELLRQDRAISEQEYETALSQRDAARAQMENRMAQRDITKEEIEKMNVFSPRAAELLNIYHGQGDYVRAGESMFLLSDLAELRATGIMSHEDIAALMQHGQDFILEIPPHRLLHRVYPMGQQAGTTEGLQLNQLAARIDSVIPAPDANAEYHEVVWHVRNPAWIMEPTYYNGVAFYSQEETRVLAVPSRALRRSKEDGGFYVYGLDEESRLVRRPVKVGIADDAFVEITEGIAEGDLVITQDPVAYTEGMRVRIRGDAEEGETGP